MQRRYKNLQFVFLLVAFQFIIGFTNDIYDYQSIVYVFISLLLACSLLTSRIKRDKKADYFPDEKIFKRNEVSPNILILGKQYIPQGHENEKDDRFFRMTEQSLISKLWLNLIIYTLIMAIILYFHPTQEYITYLFILIIGISIFTRSHGQLLYLPSITFLYIFLSIDWSTLPSSSLFISCFSLCWSTFTSFKMIHSLTKEKPLSFKHLKGSAIAFSSIVSFSFLLFTLIIPIKTLSNIVPKTEAKGRIQKMNTTLGKISESKTDARYNQNLINLANNVQNMALAPEKFDRLFDQMNTKIDQMDTLIDSVPKMNLTIQEGEKNYLKNSQQSLRSEIDGLRQELSHSQSVTPEKLKRVQELMKRIKDQSKKLKDLGIQVSDNGTDLDKEYNNTLTSSFKSALNNEVQNIGDPSLKEQIETDFPEINNNEYDSKSDQLTPEYFKNKTNELTQSLNNKIEEQESKRTLINPKKLEKIIDFIKYAFFTVIIFTILSKLKEYLQKPDEFEGEERLNAEEKRRLLLKRKYSSTSEEIRTLFLQFSEALQKIHYNNEELPPPMILNEQLQAGFTRVSKSLAYFLEVFSLSEYRNQKITNQQLEKYRKAYRKLIKRL